MEKEKHVNTKEDIEFLRKFKLFLTIFGLSIGITVCAKCSYDNLKEKGKAIDHTGIIVDDPDCEVVLNKVKCKV